MTDIKLKTSQEIDGSDFTSYVINKSKLSIQFMGTRLDTVTVNGSGDDITAGGSLGQLSIDLVGKNETVTVPSLTYGSCVAISDFGPGDHLVLPAGSYATNKAAIAAMQAINPTVSMLPVPGTGGVIDLLNSSIKAGQISFLAPATT